MHVPAPFASLAGCIHNKLGAVTVETKELLSKLDLIEEQARLTVDALPHLAKERQRMIVALVKQIRWALADATPETAVDPEATIRLTS